MADEDYYKLLMFIKYQYKLLQEAFDAMTDSVKEMRRRLEQTMGDIYD